jgi:hypothetical protein
MFEPFRCENCVHGICVDSGIFICDSGYEYNVEQCEENYEDDERM